MMIYHSFSSEETKKFGADLAKKLISDNGQDKRNWALTLALKGDLGAGKTTFTQGFLKGLGVRGRVSSPTFVLMKRFRLKNRRYKNAYHIDCYRVKKSAELSSLGLKEIFSNPENIVLVEWPERLGRVLPKGVLRINFTHKTKEGERRIVFRESLN